MAAEDGTPASSRSPRTSRGPDDARLARWSEAPAPGLDFPYMFWAHTHAGAARFSLTSSGLAPADPAFLAPLGAADLDHCGREALPRLETALAERFGVPRSRIVATLGASGGMHLCAGRWFGPGSRVVADVPSYEPFRALPGARGARLALVERRPDAGWTVDPERVRALFSGGSGPGHVFLSNPHNPSGALLGRETLIALAREAERAGGVLVSCDIYMEYVPRERAVWAFDCAPNAVSIGSLTKAYGLGALRVGWIVLGAGLERERVRLVDLAYLDYVDPPTVTLRAGAAALANLEALRAPLARLEAESRPAWARWLSTSGAVECFVPDHGIIAFPRVPGVSDTFALARHLVERHAVGVVPGEFFGCPGHVRVGCALPRAELEEGLARLEAGIRSFR